MSAKAGYANTRYVDSTAGNNTNAGTSWALAYKTLAFAVNQAHTIAAIDTILVAKGTYYPEYQAGSTTGTRDKAFTITRDSLVILGGYPTGGGTRNATANTTIMSGARDSNYHVLLTIGANIDTTLKLDGFTITKGKANGGGSRISINGFDWLFYNRGGGWYSALGTPMLSNLVITGNAADDYGGGVFIEGNPVARKLLITNNTANKGGGWCQLFGAAKADSLTFSNNSASADGGGWYNSDGTSTIANSTFNNNTANWGGGFYNSANNPTVSNCIIRNNTATTEGGGWFNYGGNPVVNNTVIAGNTAARGGGWYGGNGNALVSNMLITGNVATGNGGGFFNNGGSPVITNSTIAMNYGVSGRDLVTQNTAMTLRNSIIWSSANSTLTPQPWSGFQNCIVAGSGGSTGWNTAVGANNGGNLDVNPLFVNAVAATAGSPVTTGDYRLQSCSQAINRGSNTLAISIGKDITGRQRIIGDTVEIGAYEMIKPTGHKIYVDSAIATEGNGSSWATATRSLAEAIKVAHEGCIPVDSILVAKGTYYPEYIAGNGTTNRDKSFIFTRDSLVVIGGYASGGGVRDRNLYPTILSGVLDTVSHVMLVVGNNIDSSLRLNGIDITEGHANESNIRTVNGNSFINSNGGGVFIHNDASPVFSFVNIYSNSASSRGGGVYSRGCPTFSNCIIRDNNAVADGGGVCSFAGCMTMNLSTVASNRTTSIIGHGGGWTNYGAQVSLMNTMIKGNVAYQGGGFYQLATFASMENVLITGNVGGGLHIHNPMSITNTTIAGNIGQQLTNESNTAPMLNNCIIWGSGANSIGVTSGTPVYSNCILDGSGTSTWNAAYGTNVANNRDINPAFVNYVAATSGNPTVNGDFSLSTCSPAINRGNNAFNTNLTDIAGRPRIIGDTIDIGAYEKVKPTGHRIYVDSAATTNGNGDSWATATRSLAEAVKLAHESCTAIDTILVAKGTYYPEYIAGNGTTNRDKAFTFTRDSLVIMGGYATGGGVRNRNLYPTILSGAVDQNYHVVLITGGNIDSSLKFYGIDIAYGKADALGISIVVNGNNIDNDNGGGINLQSGSPVFSDIKVYSNYSRSGGGGMYSTGCLTLLGSNISGNTSGHNGGGIFSTGDCITVKQSIISNNIATDDGGGWFNLATSVTVANSIIRGNKSAFGGGIFNRVGAVAMANVVVSGNAAINGSGMTIDGSALLTNVTVAGNSNNQLQIISTPVILKNCIVWGGGTNSISAASGSSSYTNCILDGSGGSASWNAAYGTNGGSNRDINPLFVNFIAAGGNSPTVNGDYQLSTCSPAINRGNNTFYTNTNLTDIAGRPRIMGDTIDIGAYETAKPTRNKIYVDSAATTNGNGDSWATATRSLAEAIKLAHESCTAIDTILVSKGTYYPEYMAGNRDKSFTFTRDSLVIMGGYATGGSVRDPNLYPTVLSGAMDQNYHVMVIAGSNIDSSLKFNGIDITGGKANGSGSISVNGNSVAGDRGGGIYIASGSPVFSDIEVSSNSTSQNGGGIYSRGCPTLLNSIIKDNSAGFLGGGICTDGGGCMTVRQCTILTNNASYAGGGFCNMNAQVTIDRTSIRGNRAISGYGGGYDHSVNASASITNSVIAGNVSYNYGGGLNISGTISVTNTTVTGNITSQGGDQLHSQINAAPVFANCIIWGTGTNSIKLNGGSPPVYSNCIIDGSGGSTSWNTAYGTNGGNNRDINPAFVDYVSAVVNTPNVNGDFRLLTCSPAINRGNNTFYTSTNLTDIAGRPRIMGDTIDIGAYETAKPTGHKIYVDSASALNGNGDSWATATRSLAEAVKMAHESCMGIDTILVAKGTYYPEYLAGNGTTNKDKSFTFTRDSLVVMGGYASGGGTRDRNLYKTVLSGSKDSNYHVMLIVGNNIDSTLKIDGIDITGGRANGGSITVSGNGISHSYGGGIHVYLASPIISGVNIYSNFSQSRAGGIYSIGCPKLLNTMVMDNISNGDGGGVYIVGSCMDLDQCTISGNTAVNGGGINVTSAQVTVNRTIVSGNRASVRGGGLYYLGVNSIMKNVVISGNKADIGGGIAIFNTLGLTNVTIAGNRADTRGGQMVVSAAVAMNNCIVWGSGASSINNVGSPTCTNCLLDGSGGSAWNGTYGTNGGGNSDANPLFVNYVAATTGSPTINGDYRLQFCSPAINAGSNTAIGAISTDVAGNPRMIGTTVDIGAYEKQSTITPGNFGSNVALSNADGNASALLGTSCEDAGWTYYATANNPDSLSFAIQWGASNAAAKAAAQVQLMLDDTNTLVANGNNATTTMKRYWNVDLNGNTLAAPVAVRFFFNPADTIAMRNALISQSTGTARSLRWFKTNSGAFNPSMVSENDVNGGSITVLTPVYGTANNVAYVEFSNITSFSGGTASMGISAAPLPVQLIDFTARKIKKGQVQLKWEVVDEQLQHYEVMRSRNGSDYQSIGTVRAERNNSYSFTDLIDESSFSNNTIYYRLALVEYNGATSYSKVARINIGDVRSPIVVSPNPVQHAFAVSQVENTLIGEPVTITDATGKLIAQHILEEGLKVDASQWAPGVYFLRLPGGATVKIVKL